MGKVIFKNPNEPKQPAKGVYRWFYIDKGKEKTFYVGQAGAGRRGLVIRPSTLGRGVSELQRGAGLSNDKGRTLDVDFVVGTMIMYLVEHGFDCIWEHISNNPGEETKFCKGDDFLLQDSAGKIRENFRLRRQRDEKPWSSKDRQHVKEAEQRLYEQFREVFQ